MNTDVVVIGAGPAGLAAAITLARTGRSVVVLDRSSSPGNPFGETFPPAILSAINQLGILSQFDRCPRLKCIGVIAAWGSSEPYVQDHIVQPYGHGWHVDRSAFNSQLLEAAQQHGVLVRLGVGRIQIVRDYSRAFLDKVLRNDERTLIDSDASPYAEVTVERFGPAR